MRVRHDRRAQTRRSVTAWFAASLPRRARASSSAPSSGIDRGGSLPGRASLALRLRVYLARGRLDRQLAAAHSFDSDEALALRAHQLTREATRRSLAESLRSAVAQADRIAPHRALSAAVIRRDAVRADREMLLGLAERLETGAPVSARGVALTRVLLTDGCWSPLSNPHSELTVAEAVWCIADALAADAPVSVLDGD